MQKGHREPEPPCLRTPYVTNCGGDSYAPLKRWPQKLRSSTSRAAVTCAAWFNSAAPVRHATTTTVWQLKMHLSSLLTASALLLAAQAAPSAHQSTTVTFRVPASAALANPFSLAPATHATLTTAGQRTLSAPLTTANAFVFHNVTPGSYLVDVHAPTHVFAPLRLDVLAESDGDGHGATPVEGKGKGLILRAWDTYRANDWDNKGEAVALAEGNVFDVSAVAPKNYFAERSTCERQAPSAFSG
jgi:hypothetical protein